MTNAGEELEYTELWELPDDVTHEDVAEAWSTVTEEWEPVVAAAELKWNGSEFVVLRGESARQALIVLQRFAARSAVQLLFARWYEDGDEDALTRAHQMGDGAIAAMRATGLSELELAGELSGMLSRVGFLKSFDDALLNEARAALEAALQTGDADEWVTKWNLANVTARQGDARAALRHLDDVEEALKDWQGNAFVLVYVPGRAVADCIVKITDVGIGALLKLQRAVFTHAIDADNDCLKEAVDCCRASADSGAVQAAHVVVPLPAVAG